MGEEALETDNRRGGQYEHKARRERRGWHGPVQTVPVVEKRIDETPAGNEQVRSIVVVLGVAAGHPMGSTEHSAKPDTEAKGSPEAEP
jgi:hypothetical protein